MLRQWSIKLINSVLYNAEKQWVKSREGISIIMLQTVGVLTTFSYNFKSIKANNIENNHYEVSGFVRFYFCG